MRFSVQSTIGKVGAQFVQTTRKQIDFATVKALNEVGTLARGKVVRRMTEVFDRPTRYTLNSTRVEYLKRGDLKREVAVTFKDERFTAKKDTPPFKYAAPNVFGGVRGLKRFEVALRYFGLMAADEYAVIAKGYPTNAYGNLTAGTYRRLLSQLKASEIVAGATSNASQSRRSKAKRASRSFFVATGRQRETSRDQRGRFSRSGGRAATAGAGLPRGVYEAYASGFGRGVRAVLIFVRRPPSYRKRLDFFEQVEEAMRESFEPIFRAELAKAIATARD